jgi:hypothetical protein
LCSGIPDFLHIVEENGMTRRSLFVRAAQTLLLMLGLATRSRRVDAQPTWAVVPATANDAHEIAAIFNGHVQEGKCPNPERAPHWEDEDAEKFLTTYDATIMITRNGTPVGFAGLVDYTTEKGRRSILPGAIPTLSVFAIADARLGTDEQLPAAKRLAVAVGRKLNAMGFDKCEMLIKADPIFNSDNWFRSNMAIESVERKDGRDHALHVKLDVGPILAALEAEGL